MKRICVIVVLVLGIILLAYHRVRDAVFHVHMPETGWKSVTIKQHATRFQEASTSLLRSNGRLLRRKIQYGPLSIAIILDSMSVAEGYYWHMDVGVRKRIDLHVEIDPDSKDISCRFELNGKEPKEHHLRVCPNVMFKAPYYVSQRAGRESALEDGR
jgi:hypothetical protein